MRGKTFFSGVLRSSRGVLSCLLLTLLAFGCKEKTEPTARPEQTREVATEQQKTDASDKEQPNQLTFKLNEVSVFDLSEELSRDFLRGQTVFCDHSSGRSRSGQYPRFESAKPIYGTISFAGKIVGHTDYDLAIDESAGTGKGYDRLYLDRNGDRDLTNDKPLTALKDPPSTALRQYSSMEQ